MNKDINNLIIVSMNDAKISTLESPVIGTHSLATCLGILLYDDDSKRAIVAHMTSSDSIIVIDKIFNIIIKNKLINVKFKYKIFEGYYTDAYNYYDTIETILKHFKDFEPFDEKDIPNTAINTDSTLGANEFYFNAQTGKFVTNEVLSLENNNTKIR